MKPVKITIDDKVLEASRMWLAGGMSGRNIAELLGIDQDRFWKTTKKYRNLFPEKSRAERVRATVALPIRLRPIIREDTMKWTTISGAVVTLPRVRFLEGRG